MKILVPLNSRILSFDKAFKNNAPKDFFYGGLSYPKISIENNFLDTRPNENFFNENRLIKKFNQ